jgi:hypothetical protein
MHFQVLPPVTAAAANTGAAAGAAAGFALLLVAIWPT